MEQAAWSFEVLQFGSFLVGLVVPVGPAVLVVLVRPGLVALVGLVRLVGLRGLVRARHASATS